MKKPVLCIALVLMLLLSACSLPAGPRLPSTPTLPTAPPAPAGGSDPVFLIGVFMHLNNDAAAVPQVYAGSSVPVILEFQPAKVVIQREDDGRALSSSWQPWEDHPAVEMRACFSLEGPCQPEGDWQPYAPRITYEFDVDWLGPHDIHAAVQFRDGAGIPVPAGSPADGQPVEIYQVFLNMVSLENPDLPVETLSPAVQTASAATRSAFPVTGSVLIEDGRCCAGGKAGAEIDLKVSFEAESPYGEVIWMRVQSGGACRHSEAALDTTWEPFAADKTLRTTLATNWVGYYINVQYRDSEGNLSPVYCDDISLEGSP